MSNKTDLNFLSSINLFDQVLNEIKHVATSQVNTTNQSKASIEEIQIQNIAQNFFQAKAFQASPISTLTRLEEKVKDQQKTIHIIEGVTAFLQNKNPPLLDKETIKLAKQIYRKIEEQLKGETLEDKQAQAKHLQQQLSIFKEKLVQQTLETTQQAIQEQSTLKKFSKLKEQALKEGAPAEELELIIQRGLNRLQKSKIPSEKSTIELQIQHSIDGLVATAKLASHFGNKTANLHRLKEIFLKNDDVVIPLFKGIPHEDVLLFISSHFPEFEPLWSEFQNHLAQNKDIESAAPLLSKIQEGIKQAFLSSKDFPSEDIIKLFDQSDLKLMIRSTGREDSLKVANPGGNESIANVNPTRSNIAHAMGSVVASYFSTKSIGQRAASGDDIRQPPFMPVLLQVMVGETEGYIPTSGVMYTTEGGLETDGVTQISAGLGHAEGIVTGSQANDIYYVQGKFIHGIIQSKLTRKAPQDNGKLKTTFNPRPLRNAPCLTEKQLHRLIEIGKKIEQDYGYPVDVEWSYDTKTNKFYVFQARPITHKFTSTRPSYIAPQKMKELQDIQQVAVIEAGGGGVCELNKNNVFVCSSAKEALEKYLLDPKNPPRAVLLAQPTAPNSHEAGFFRERGIPVIYLPGNLYQKISDALKNQTVLIDTQEGFSAILPTEKKAKDYIVDGLRRHLAPKMESFIKEASTKTYDGLIKQLQVQAAHFDPKNLKLAFGWNALDQLLNTFEEVQDPEAKAYLLNTVLYIVEKKLLPKLPPDQREQLFLKILYNIENVWTIYQDPEADLLNQKFAMSWLRSAILQRPVEGVVNSDTLYTTLDAVKERKGLDLALPSTLKNQDEQAYLDVFQRSQKFILLPDFREDWNTFIHHLDLRELKQLAAIFTQLGPQLVEIWINSVFVTTWDKLMDLNDKQKQAEACMQKFLVIAQDSKVQEALVLQEQTKIVAKQLGDLATEFGNPNQFDKLLSQLDQKLLKITYKCLKTIQQAKDIELTVHAQSLDILIATFDNCIKGLTGSAFYQNDLPQKVEKFILLLDRYLELTCMAMSPKILKDSALLMQAKRLQPYLIQLWEPFKKKMRIDPQAALLPTKNFSAAMSALGSGLQKPSRAPPDSLEDLFTLLHQTLITIVQSVSSRSGIQQDDLPPLLRKIADFTQMLSLHSSTLSKPTIQSITYHYPHIKINFNCPLNFHSAQIVIDARISPKGKITSIEMEGRFFVPMNVLDVPRDKQLMLIALNSYYGDPRMLLPKDYEPSPPQNGYVQFKWKIPVSTKDEAKNVTWNALDYLQIMIDHLQKVELGKDLSSLMKKSLLFEDFPWALDLILEDDWFRSTPEIQQDVINAALKGILKNPNENNLIPIVKHIRRYITSKIEIDVKLLDKVIDLLIDQEFCWKTPEMRLDLTKFFSVLIPDKSEKASFKQTLNEKVVKLNLLTPERLKKIQEKFIPLIIEDMNRPPKDTYLNSLRQIFIDLFTTK